MYTAGTTAAKGFLAMRTAGIALILLALTALWLYNTGRLEAVLSVVKDPAYKPGKTEYVSGLGTIPIDTSGIGGIFGSGGFGTPPIVGGGTDWLSTLGGIFGGIAPFLGL